MPPAQPSPLVSFIPIIAIFSIFYFLIIRPQQKQMKAHQKMLEGLKKGDRVLTGGGVYGTVAAVLGQDVEVLISEGVKVLVARSTITRVIEPKTSDAAQA